MAGFLAGLAASAAGSIAASSGSIVSTLIGARSAKKENAKERKFNAEQAQLNRDYQTQERLATQEWNEEMWNKNNEYNSASAQVQRMLQAGINPNTAFGGSYSAAQAAAPTSNPQAGGAASYSSGLGASLLSTLSQQALNVAQIQKLGAETEQTKEVTKTISPKTKAEIQKIFSDIGVNDFNKSLQEKTFSLYQNKTDAEIKVMDEQLNKLRNESLDIIKGIQLKDVQIAGTEAATKLTESQTSGQNIDNALQRLMLDYSNITGIPVGTPECHALFTLWSQGKMQAISDKLALNSAESENPINKAAGMTGVVANKVGRALESVVKGIGQIFTK